MKSRFQERLEAKMLQTESKQSKRKSMKNLTGIKALTVIVSFAFTLYLFFKLDQLIVNWALIQFPLSAHEWLGVIKIGLWIVMLCLSCGLAFGIAALVASLVVLLIHK